MTPAPMEIYQAFLDEGCRLIMDGHFDAVAERMVYPQTMETSDGALTYEGPEDMKQAAASFRDFLARMGTSDFHRICDMAEVDASGTVISGEHTTYIIRGGQFAVPPYRNRMWLRHHEGRWRGAGIAAAVSNRVCTILAPEQLQAARDTTR